MTWIKNIFEGNVASLGPRTIGPQNVDFYGHYLEFTQSNRRKPQRWVVGPFEILNAYISRCQTDPLPTRENPEPSPMGFPGAPSLFQFDKQITISRVVSSGYDNSTLCCKLDYAIS